MHAFMRLSVHPPSNPTVNRSPSAPTPPFFSQAGTVELRAKSTAAEAQFATVPALLVHAAYLVNQFPAKAPADWNAAV
jgi:hypothetical protein